MINWNDQLGILGSRLERERAGGLFKEWIREPLSEAYIVYIQAYM